MGGAHIWRVSSIYYISAQVHFWVRFVVYVLEVSACLYEEVSHTATLKLFCLVKQDILQIGDTVTNLKSLPRSLEDMSIPLDNIR